MNRHELKIGDALEVERFIQPIPDFPKPISAIWVPATVCAAEPLSVAFADGTWMPLHRGNKIREFKP